MKIEKFKDINWDEWEECAFEEAEASLRMKGTKVIYLRKAQKFPVVFEDYEFKINVLEKGVQIETKQGDNFLYFVYGKDFPLLVKAVKKIEELGLAHKRGCET